MKLWYRISLVACLIALFSGAIASAQAAQGPHHWVDDELAAFKQEVMPLVENLSYSDRISREEWEIISTTVLDQEKLDQPIHIAHWAILLKLVLDPDQGKNHGRMLDWYVYNLSTGTHMHREDAIGGLVKLLTMGYISGSGSAAELEPAKDLKDLADIDERQNVLVQIAYCEGILDSATKNKFRPKDDLTNAEAISILYKVITKYHIGFAVELNFPRNHWASSSIARYLKNAKPGGEHLKLIDSIVNSLNNEDVLDEPVEIGKWHDLLIYAMQLNNSKYDQSLLQDYTYGLAHKEYISRGHAVAGMMKLLHIAEIIPGRDATDRELAHAAGCFRDFPEAFDQSKLAIAYSEGLVSGYEGGYFYPQKLLTKGEAMVLIDRIRLLLNGSDH